MDENALYSESQKTFPARRWDIYESLLDEQKTKRLTVEEAEQLGALRFEADILTLRKAYAAVLLKRRGYNLPSIDELPPAS